MGSCSLPGSAPLQGVVEDKSLPPSIRWPLVPPSCKILCCFELKKKCLISYAPLNSLLNYTGSQTRSVSINWDLCKYTDFVNSTVIPLTKCSFVLIGTLVNSSVTWLWFYQQSRRCTDVIGTSGCPITVPSLILVSKLCSLAKNHSFLTLRPFHFDDLQKNRLAFRESTFCKGAKFQKFETGLFWDSGWWTCSLSLVK